MPNGTGTVTSSIAGSSLMHVVTGANMGGKSTWMRSCGVGALLAHAGCWLPAAAAALPRLAALSARVGAGDAELRGQSTFMREMLECAAILRVCHTTACCFGKLSKF